MWPQYVFIILIIFGLGVSLAKDGEPKGNYNFALELISTVITIWLLWAGDFFKGMF